MQITLTLSTEETDALNERVDLYNAGSGQAPVTAAEFLKQEQCLAFVRQLVTTKRENTALQLKAAADSLPYEKRIELAKMNRDFITTALNP
jgi:hypothetical protein